MKFLQYFIVILMSATVINCGGGSSERDQVELANKFADSMDDNGFDWDVAKALTKRGDFAVFLNEARNWEAVDLKNYNGKSDAFDFIIDNGSVAVNSLGNGDFEDRNGNVYNSLGGGLPSVEGDVVAVTVKDRTVMALNIANTYNVGPKLATRMASSIQYYNGEGRTQKAVKKMVEIAFHASMDEITEAAQAELEGDAEKANRLIERTAADFGESTENARNAIHAFLNGQQEI